MNCRSPKPQRPQGIERNIVVTLWDWGRPTGYLHDLVSTDRRNPRLNANGKVYGSPEDSTDFVPILDPVTSTASEVLHPVRDPEHAVVEIERDGAVASLGTRSHLGQQDAQPQSDVRREGACMVHRAHPP